MESVVQNHYAASCSQCSLLSLPLSTSPTSLSPPHVPMRTPLLQTSSPAELSVGLPGPSNYFDLPPTQSPVPPGPGNTPHVVQRFLDATQQLESALPQGLFGRGIQMHGAYYLPGFDLSPWQDPSGPRGQPRMGSSPRQRPGFLREATSTPAFTLPSSPLVREDELLSPSLPVLAPEAPATVKRAAPKRTRKKLFAARRWANSQAFWLGAYFAFNLSLTLYNKGVLVRFPYPYTLTAVHALFGSIGGLFLRRQNVYTPARLGSRHYVLLAAFSVLYAVNIAVSNISLHMVTIPVSVCTANTSVFTLTSFTVPPSSTRVDAYVHHTPFLHPTQHSFR